MKDIDTKELTIVIVEALMEDLEQNLSKRESIFEIDEQGTQVYNPQAQKMFNHLYDMIENIIENYIEPKNVSD